VRYALEGSVQRGSNRIRVNAQLIDTENGNHLWADRFEKPIDDLFEMQDEIVARLANALNAQLVVAEARRAERTPTPDSMDDYFQGLAEFNSGLSQSSRMRARTFFERALALDPSNVEALIGSAAVDVLLAGTYSIDDRSRFEGAEATLTKALALAPDHALAHLWIGAVQIYTNRASQGAAECERALVLDRNLALAHGFIGLAKIMCGRPEETELHLRGALRLSPSDIRLQLWKHLLGVGKLHLGGDEEAAAHFRRSIEIDRNTNITHFYLAATLALLGELDEARSEVRSGLSLNPNFSIARFRAGASGDNRLYLAQRERVCDGMRKASARLDPEDMRFWLPFMQSA
jgi:tetratricopeptide (TPR) repeat protein